MQTDDDPDDIQLLDGVLFYTPDNQTAPQLNKEEREQIAKRWMDAQQ